MPYDPGYILLDKYRIEKPLGQGAFGEVYLVTHLQLNVLRVIKVLRRDAPGMDSDIYYGPPQARFKLEAQLGARLNSPHPNPRLLQIFNLHADERLSVLEMEYAAGGSLAQRIEKNRTGNQLMPLDEALRIAVEVAEGLAALHKLDIVHRDVKPANILFDEEGHAHLGDLGLAQAPGGDSGRSQLSTPKPQPGTAAYMSPEQQNSGAYLPPASDIYSLGATLFEALTGRIYSGQRPGTRAASLRADLPKEVDDLLARMLSESPRERPWDGAEAAGFLKAVLAGAAPRRAQAEQKKPVAPVPPARSVPPEAGKGFLARYWGWMVLAVLLLGGCLVLLPLFVSLAARSTPAAAPSPTAAPSLLAGSYTRPADGMTMLYVPGATFTMGSADISNATPHQVTLSPYWIDQTDVTNAEYAKCVAAGGCTEPSNKRSATRSSYYGNSQFDNYPVIYVNWNQAKSYCEWAGAKLPSEAQWELAARGMEGRTYPWAGNTIDKSYANFNQNVGDTTAVCSYPQGVSPYGACDMAGNVWQWTADWYGNYGTSPVSNPNGPADGTYRVLRGGSWLSLNSYVRSALRFDIDPSLTNVSSGFRCARSQ